MSYGIFIGMGQRPKSKKQIREILESKNAVMSHEVRLENTSLFGGYDGMVEDAPDGRYDFVGPDPHRLRNFYGNIIVTTKNGEKHFKVT